MTITQAKKILRIGNHKLSNNIATWSLPATQEVCGRVCEGCYAIKAQNIYRDVLKSRERKLALSNSPEFITTLCDAIRTLSPPIVRIHDSGEFYSQRYVNDWAEIAERSASILFYTYTKRMKDFDFTALDKHNVVIINSLQSGKLNYGKLEDKPDGMQLCPDYKGSEIREIVPTGPICGTLCTYCMTKHAQENGVYFKKH